MRETSALYKKLWAMPHTKEIKVDIAGVEYSQAEIFSCRIYGGIYEKPTIGTCSSRTLSLKIMPKGTIPRGAKIAVFARLAAGGEVSEWIKQGEFFISLRPRDKRTGAMNITAYDAMLKANAVWLNGSYDEVNWPMAESEAVADIANRMGIVLDSRTVLDNAYPLDYPVDENGDMTMWNVLCGIAVSNCGSWVITPDGNLRLVRFGQTYDGVDVGFKAESMDTGAEPAAITRVNLGVDSAHMYTAGNDTGRTIEVECPWGSQQMADKILSTISGVQYKPYTAERALVDIAFELGDSVSVGELGSVIASADCNYNGGSLVTIAAPDLDEIDDEYPAQQTQQSSLKRQLAYTRSLITKTAEEIRLSVEGFDGRISALAVTLDGVTVSDENGQTLIKGSSIDTSTIKANSISADKVNLTGSISFGDLTESAQTTITEAVIAANTASGKVQAWAYGGGTYIDGNMIMAGTVMASKLLGGSVGLMAYDQTVVGSMDIAYTSTGVGLGINTNYGGIKIQAGGGNVWIESDTGASLMLGDGNVNDNIPRFSISGILTIGGSNYGSALPTTRLVEGRVFFLKGG